MNPDWWVLLSVVDEAEWGKNADRWRSGSRPCGITGPPTSSDRGVVVKKAEEMGQDGVDMWTFAWSQVDPDKSINVFFIGHLFISHCWFLAMPQGETGVLKGGASFTGFNGKKEPLVFRQKADLMALRCPFAIFSPGVSNKGVKKKKRLNSPSNNTSHKLTSSSPHTCLLTKSTTNLVNMQ